MFDNSKCLSQNPLKESTYIGKDVGLLKNRIFCDKYIIDDDVIYGYGVKNTKPSNKYYKLSTIYNFLYALSNTKRKNNLEKCIELYKCIGTPASVIYNEKKKEYMELDPIAIYNTDYTLDVEKLDIINNLSSNNFSEIALPSNKVRMVLVKNPNLITEYLALPASTDIFDLAFYFYFRMQDFSLKNHFICSECGNVYFKKSNKVRFCATCKDKIDFPKISHSKKSTKK